MSELYDILGVSPHADDRAIKSAFRRMARQHHPDLNPGDPAAAARFVQLAAAFDVLQNPTTRALYDEFGADGLAADFDPVRARWARAAAAARRPTPRPGYARTTSTSSNHHHDEGSWADRFKREYDLDQSSFKDIFDRAARDFDPFSHVDAEPYVNPFVEPGQDVRATLDVPALAALRGDAIPFVTPNHQSITVRLTPGVAHGEVLLIAQHGAPAERPGGSPGDLLLTVNLIAHPAITRDGLDILLSIPISIPEALLGARITIPTPHGDRVMTLPEGVHSGARLRLRQMGLHRDGNMGDLYAVIEVRAPPIIDEETRQIARQLASAYPHSVREDLGF